MLIPSDISYYTLQIRCFSVRDTKPMESVRDKKLPRRAAARTFSQIDWHPKTDVLLCPSNILSKMIKPWLIFQQGPTNVLSSRRSSNDSTVVRSQTNRTNIKHKVSCQTLYNLLWYRAAIKRHNTKVYYITPTAFCYLNMQNNQVKIIRSHFSYSSQLSCVWERDDALQKL